MELSNFLAIIRRRWGIITSSILVGILGAAVFSLTSSPVYTAKTQLFVATNSSGTVSELQQGNNFSQARVQSYLRTVKTPLVLEPVIEALGLDVTPSELSKHLDASADINTVIISISAEDESPVQAAAIAQAVGESLMSTVAELERPSATEASPVRLSMLTPASAPTSPSSPNVNIALAIGAVLGMAVGVGIAVIRTLADTRIRTEEDFRKVSDKPILGGIAYDAEVNSKPLLTSIPSQSPRAESFRQIRTNLQFAHVSNKTKTVLITSSLPGEGKSTTAANIAIALAQAGSSVLLIDADLRRPMVSDYLGLERSAGLTTALLGEVSVWDLLQPWGEDNLQVLASGQIPANPSELLGSQSMVELLGTLESHFDMIVIDAPPLLPVTDASVLAQLAGGVVLVVGATKTRSRELEKAISALDMVNADLLGVVLNMRPTRGPDAYSYSYYSSTYETPKVKSRRPTGSVARPAPDARQISRRASRRTMP